MLKRERAYLRFEIKLLSSKGNIKV